MRNPCRCTYLDRANINRTIDEVVPDIYFGMLGKDLTRNIGVLLGWVASDRLIMQALRCFRIQNEDGRVSLWSDPRTSATACKEALGDAPGPMVRAALFYYHRHDSVLVRFSTLFVNTNDFIDPDVADEITRDENEVGSDDPVRVDISHGISRRKCLLRSDNGDDLQASTGLGPFGVSIWPEEIRKMSNDVKGGLRSCTLYCCLDKLSM